MSSRQDVGFLDSVKEFVDFVIVCQIFWHAIVGSAQSFQSLNFLGPDMTVTEDSDVKLSLRQSDAFRMEDYRYASRRFPRID